jgi:hypothetical protein
MTIEPKSNVVGLRGLAIADHRVPNKNVVESLEWLLEAAKSGEVSGIACAYDNSDKSTGFSRVGIVSRATIGVLHTLISAIVEDLNK